MADQTYHFNAYTVGVWVNPDNLVDGDIGTFAASGAKKTAQVLTGNTCPGTDLGTITKVEFRVFAYGDGDDRLDITPIFTGGNGDTHPTTPVVSPGAWTAYVDITNDTNHPDWSLWSHIQNLDCQINNVAVSKANVMYASKVEIRVSYWVPPVSDIDVGAAPIPRPTVATDLLTIVDKNNPANASGRLHSVKVYAQTSMTGLRVGTFYPTNGNTLKCRDSAVIGDVEAGAERTFTELSIAIEAGDYIGCYFRGGGRMERHISGFAGYWNVSGEHIDPNDEAEYAFKEGDAISLYGYGDIEAPPVGQPYIKRVQAIAGMRTIGVNQIG
ncbi:hypothetical protein ES703_119551 [subsurface metagenome]